MLDTSIEQCPVSGSVLLPSPVPVIFQIPKQQPALIDLYHIAYLLVPVFGCLISLVVGSICSFLSGGHKRASKVNPDYLSKYAWILWPSSWLPDHPHSLENGDHGYKAGFKSGSIILGNNNNHDKSSINDSLASTCYIVNEKGSKLVCPSDSMEDDGNNPKKRMPRIVKQNALDYDDNEFHKNVVQKSNQSTSRDSSESPAPALNSTPVTAITTASSSLRLSSSSSTAAVSALGLDCSTASFQSSSRCSSTSSAGSASSNPEKTQKDISQRIDDSRL